MRAALLSKHPTKSPEFSEMNPPVSSPQDLADRSSLNPETGCWEWNLSLRNGYGLTWYEGKKARAHRLMWTLLHGDPGDHYVCHKCDNCACINPDHLWLGTAQDNMRDAASKGRLGSSNPIYPAELVRQIRAEAIPSFGLVPQRVIAKKYGVSREFVNALVRCPEYRTV